MLRSRWWFIGTTAPVLQRRTTPQIAPPGNRGTKPLRNRCGERAVQRGFVIRSGGSRREPRDTFRTGRDGDLIQGWVGQPRPRNGDESVAIPNTPRSLDVVRHEGPQVLADDPHDRELV